MKPSRPRNSPLIGVPSGITALITASSVIAASRGSGLPVRMNSSMVDLTNVTLSSIDMSPPSESGFRALGLDALEALGLVGDEAHVLAAAAFLDGVADRELEGHAALVDVDELDVDRDVEA